MSKDGFVLHGPLVYCRDRKNLCVKDEAYIVSVGGISQGVYDELPDEFSGLPVEDLWDKLILPGFTDLHVHASQYQLRGLSMDLELLPWLEKYVFPTEARFSDQDYAERAYDQFVEELYLGATTRAVVFASADVDSTLILMDLLEDSGLVSYVGKVNMDRNVPDYYVETTEESLANTRAWLDVVQNECEYINTYPILTPRFTPTCTPELLRGLGELAKDKGLPVQSHISENPGEVEWVKSIDPESRFYGETYSKAGLFGENGPCIMAHCVWSTEEEISLMQRNGVYVAHCPESNMNLSSGIAPVSAYLDRGMNVGLASDISAGANSSLFVQMRLAVGVSKLRKYYGDSTTRPLTFEDVFYMATLGGGSFFGKVGSFEPGYEFDAVIVDDSNLQTVEPMKPRDRVERLCYLGDDRNIWGKIVRGRRPY